ncbi:MAG: hypothetical protein DI626_02960 [Micavibrio aeruginosavorus]|uniref:Uncharacterized protein n=1 Tax=Micavibrio aeruginosavorus TaxID=349221 RepID=A0A2W5A051_9BACT|nr:MAG: hypothetical protein DI626_02960 [Micavibrio aeruginosavorus]
MLNKPLNINAKSAIKYAVLPGILPRLRDFATSGFGFLAFLFANVFGGVRILPPGHRFLKQENMGKFGVIAVIREAADHIQLNRKNIDKIVIFGILLSAVILLALQFLLLVLALMTGRAFAETQGAAFDSIFVTKYPTSDIAFLLLDYIFGIPAAGATGMGPNLGFFGSAAIPAGSTPFHNGLHELFLFYNMAILVVAVLIFLYYVFVVVVETAQTGVPFGQRFAKIYAPIRLVIALGLLVPLNYGFNGAQYLTLVAAKMGSSFATNGWITYNRSLNNPTGIENESLVALPRSPSIRKIVEFSSVYHACRDIYGQFVYKKEGANSGPTVCIKPYVIVNGNAQEFVQSSCAGETSSSGSSRYTYQQAKKDFGTTEIEVVLGELDKEKHGSYAGGVYPYCGKMTISLTHNNPSIFDNNASAQGGAGPVDVIDYGQANDIGGNILDTISKPNAGGQDKAPIGINAVENIYYGTVQELLGQNSMRASVFNAFGERMARKSLSKNFPCHRSGELQDGGSCQSGDLPKQSVFVEPIKRVDENTRSLVKIAYDTYRKNLNLKLSEDLERRGWGGAGIWYNNIADLNGAFTGAVYATPSVRQFPSVMEFVKKERQIQDKASSACEMFEPHISANKAIVLKNTKEDTIARLLNETYRYFNSCTPRENATGGQRAQEGGGTVTEETKSQGANVIIIVIKEIFGLNGLFDLRATSKLQEETGMPLIHPLAQLSTIGKSLVENAIRSMAMAIGAAFGSGMASALDIGIGPALGMLSSMFVSIATIGLTAGFILFYILPFLPFLYFFFAVASWVKSIFEAMVGVPLWALAHIRIDGEGIPGRAATGGYFLLFEIFLRPITIVFGLIAGIAVFGASAAVLNSVFDIVVANVTGVPADATGDTTIGSIESFRRGVIDQFFYTIMYTILVYMMATASFKMIDAVPANIMRWIGSGVSKFNDNAEDPTGGLTQYAALGGAQISGQVMGGLSQGASGLGAALGSVGKVASK